MNIEIGDNFILLKLHEAEKITKGGIIIPDSVNAFHKSKATVIKTGIGHYDELTGNFTPIFLKENDVVSLSSHLCHSQNEFIFDNIKYHLVREVDIDVKIEN